MFQTAEVEHAHATIRTAGDKHIDAVCAKPYVIYFFVVSDELRLGRKSRDIPDGAGGINAGCDDKAGGDRVPVEGGNRGSVFRRL